MIELEKPVISKEMAEYIESRRHRLFLSDALRTFCTTKEEEHVFALAWIGQYDIKSN